MRFPWQGSIEGGKGNTPIIRFIITILSIVSFCLIFPVSDGLAKTKGTRIVKTKAKKIVANKKRFAHKKLSKNKKKARPHIARKKPTVSDSNPLVHIIPLENGDYLLKPLDRSNVQNKSQGDMAGKNPIADPLSSGGSPKPSQNPIPPQVEPISSKAVSPEPVRLVNTDKTREEGYCKRFANLLLTTAKQLLGAPYRYGGVSVLRGIDCSGFVQKVFAKFGVLLPRSSREQANVGMLVTNKFDWSKLRIGDVLFFRRSPSSGQIGHTGIYMGDGKMIHAARRDGSVTVSSLEKPYYKKTFIAAKRFFIFSPSQSSNI